MKNSILKPITLVLAAVVLAGCGRDIPSCGDVEATKMVSQILAENVTKDTGVMEEDFKKRVHFAVEQPVILVHDEKVSTYSCKGIAKYKITDSLLAQIQRTAQDKKYEAELWKNWRTLIGLFSASDVTDLVTQFGEAEEKNDPKKDDLRDQLAQVLGIDRNFTTTFLAGSIIGYPAQQRQKEITDHVALIEHVLTSMDKNTKEVPFEVQYTIAKIDGEGKKFTVNVKADSGMLNGIQNLEILQSAAQLTEQPAIAAAKPTPIQVEAAASQPRSTEVVSAAPTQPVEQVKPEPIASAAQIASEVKPPVAEKPVTQKNTIEASFDCTKAAAKIEKLICSTPETASSDKRLSAAYSAARTKSSDEQKLKSDQVQWMKTQRNVCDDSACLLKVTEERIKNLSL